MFEERAAMKFARFSLENYVQTDLAWGLGLIAEGDNVRGPDLIAKFCSRSKIEPNNTMLRKSMAEASDICGN